MKFTANSVYNTLRTVFIYALIMYLGGAILVFDFFSAAGSQDESTHNGNTVAIGPRPRSWVPKVSDDLDIPGGYSYSTSDWPFVVWRPICLIYLKMKGYERPIEWR